MILELLINLIFGVAVFMIDLIPDFTFDGNIFLAITSVANVINGASYLLPMNTFLICLSVFFILHNAALIIAILNWIIRKIPGVN